jgi:hypothetical protein
MKVAWTLTVVPPSFAIGKDQPISLLEPRPAPIRSLGTGEAAPNQEGYLATAMNA